MQGGVGNLRLVGRGGGPGGVDWLVTPTYSNARNCSELCKYLETTTMDLCAGCVADCYYAKCFEGNFSVPLNFARFAFASQLGSMGIDPALPQLNASLKTCIGIHFNFEGQSWRCSQNDVLWVSCTLF